MAQWLEPKWLRPGTGPWHTATGIESMIMTVMMLKTMVMSWIVMVMGVLMLLLINIVFKELMFRLLDNAIISMIRTIMWLRS